MDQFASVLLDFPPAGGIVDDDLYHSEAKAHSQKVERLVGTAEFVEVAAKLFDHVDPSINSISHIGLILAAKNANSLPQAEFLARVSVFLVTFDARQIRYAGRAFAEVLDWVLEGALFPASVAVDLATTALLRLDPTGSVLTSHHVSLVKLAYTTDNVKPALPILEKEIVFYPGAKSLQTQQSLGHPDLPPASYITTDSGLTRSLVSLDVLQYDLLRGLGFIQQRSWSQAFAALERVITYPVRDSQGSSKAMVEAHNKWVLVGLLLHGKPPTIPPTTAQGAQKVFGTLGKPYQTIAAAFTEKTAESLKREVESLGAAFFGEENNFNLVRLVIQHYQRWQILNLRNVYTKISLEQIRTRTQSAETAAPLATEEQIGQLVQQMIDEGMLQGVIERPESGPAYLVFSPTSQSTITTSASNEEELSERDFAERMLVTAQRLKALEPLVRATNERLGTSRDYVRFVAGQQRGGKDWQRDYGGLFMNQVEDEDLMKGFVAGF